MWLLNLQIHIQAQRYCNPSDGRSNQHLTHQSKRICKRLSCNYTNHQKGFTIKGQLTLTMQWGLLNVTWVGGGLIVPAPHISLWKTKLFFYFLKAQNVFHIEIVIWKKPPPLGLRSVISLDSFLINPLVYLSIFHIIYFDEKQVPTFRGWIRQKSCDTLSSTFQNHTSLNFQLKCW